LGSFIFFAGKNFTIPMKSPALYPENVVTITGVVPWMVVVILAREMLVTTLRGSMEGSGENFGAQFSGKLKMVFQSVTILVILVYVNYWYKVGPDIAVKMRVFRDLCIWATVFITVLSGLLYVQRAVALYRKRAPGESAAGEKGG
jgi:CDP-diacylglycerol---glycerol-3-phosphate 3-phosphatidyltransferase